MGNLTIKVSPKTVKLEGENENNIIEIFDKIGTVLKENKDKYRYLYGDSDLLVTGYVNFKDFSIGIISYGKQNFTSDTIISILLIAIKHSEIIYQKSSDIKSINLDFYSLSEDFYDIRDIDRFRLKVDLEIEDSEIKNVKITGLVSEKNLDKAEYLDEELDMMFNSMFNIRNLESKIFKAKEKVNKNKILKYETEYDIVIDNPKESGYIKNVKANVIDFMFMGMN